MKIRDVIIVAQKEKLMIKNEDLNMRAQTAKSLIHWLFVDNRLGFFGKILYFFKLLKSNTWELEK